MTLVLVKLLAELFDLIPTCNVTASA